MHTNPWQCLSTLLLGSYWYLNCIWYQNTHLSSAHCSKSLQTGFLDLLPYSLISSWFFSSHPCLFWAQGPIPSLGDLQNKWHHSSAKHSLRLSCAELGSVHSVVLLPFSVTRSHRGPVIDCLSVPCVLPASHQLSKFSSGRGRTVDSQPFILMVNFG